MGRIPTGHCKRELQKLTSQHIQILERLVRGHRPKDIARDMGICTQTISKGSISTVRREMLDKMFEKMDRDMFLKKEL